MYKSRLQEMCQKRRWAPPLYEQIREGPCHAPRFRATVVVNGETFSSLGEGERSVKEAYNLAAMAAFENLSALPPAAPAPAPAAPAPPRPGELPPCPLTIWDQIRFLFLELSPLSRWNLPPCENPMPLASVPIEKYSIFLEQSKIIFSFFG